MKFHLISATLLSFLGTYFAIKYFIKLCCYKNIIQPISKYLPQHKNIKSDIPTMGGIPVLLNIIACICLLCDVTNYAVILVLVTIVLFGLIGLNDDIQKISKKNNIGDSAKKKMLLLILASLLICVLHFFLLETNTFLLIPFINLKITLSYHLYYLFVIFMICGSANAVNLTDGLDGLAASIISIIAFALFIITICLKHDISLFYNYIQKDIAIICIVICGSYFGFIWYNCNPASIFMGDCSSLSIGAVLSVISILLKQEILFGLLSVYFVIEVLSVILQVFVFKLSRGSIRVLKMAPLHHHFEQIGIQETKITSRSVIFTIIVVFILLLGLLL